MWLGEYQGHYSLTEPTHVMAAGDPFAKTRGAVLKTHDGREWVAEDSGTYTLIHVDGALPWIAQVGDTIQYAEFVDKAGKGEIYEAQRIENQIEFAVGKPLPIDVVGRAFGRSDLVRETKAAPAADTADRRKWYLRLILLAAAFILLNGRSGLLLRYLRAHAVRCVSVRRSTDRGGLHRVLRSARTRPGRPVPVLGPPGQRLDVLGGRPGARRRNGRSHLQ